jgi:hypothetical protein
LRLRLYQGFDPTMILLYLRSRLLLGSDSEVSDVPILGEELRLYLADEISSDADSFILILVDHFLTPLRVEQLIEMQRRSSDGAGGGHKNSAELLGVPNGPNC